MVSQFSITRVDGQAYPLCCLCWRHVDRTPHPTPHMLCVVCAGGMLTKPPTPPRGGRHEATRPQSAETCEDTWGVVVNTVSDTELLLNLL